MSGKCVIKSCDTFEDDPNYSFFEVSPNWLKYCGLGEGADKANLKICHRHFAESDFVTDLNQPLTRILHAQAVPINYLEGPDVNKTNPKLNSLVISEVVRNATLKDRFSQLEQELNDLNDKADTLDKRQKRKDEVLKKIETKYNRLRRNANVKDTSSLLSKVFSDAQINCLLGRKKVVWTDDDMAMAFTLRHMSSRECYLYLKQTLNMPLPSLSSVQKWAASK